MQTGMLLHLAPCIVALRDLFGNRKGHTNELIPHNPGIERIGASGTAQEPEHLADTMINTLTDRLQNRL